VLGRDGAPYHLEFARATGTRQGARRRLNQDAIGLRRSRPHFGHWPLTIGSVKAGFTATCIQLSRLSRGLAIKTESNTINEKLMAGFSANQVKSMIKPGAAVHPRRTLILVACMMVTATAAIEATVVATAMPTIVAELHGAELYFVGVLRLHVDAGRHDPDLWPARRSVRPQARVHSRVGALFYRLSALWLGFGHDRLDFVPGVARPLQAKRLRTTAGPRQ
jgi:hypothetical protein